MAQARPCSLSDLWPRAFAVVLALNLLISPPTRAQNAAPKPAPSSEKASGAPENPAQIELLETRIRFEANGDSRKEVHTRVHINNELGARQFALLNFDFNRSFQQIELPLVRITHASGGTADILPSAITDLPNPAVADAPAYQDIRIKSLRILGLAPGDDLEYRIVTTTTRHPLAPDFWLAHSFSHDAIVSQELFEVSIPRSRKVKVYTLPGASANKVDESGDGANSIVTYRWKRSADPKASGHPPEGPTEPEIVFTTYESWQQLCHSKLAAFFGVNPVTPPEIAAKASALTQGAANDQAKIEAIYDFVSQVKTIDLPLDTTGFRTRTPAEILSSGYATPADKFVLFSALANSAAGITASAALASISPLKETADFPRPSAFDHVLARVTLPSSTRWLDFNVAVAPYGVIPSQLRGQRALLIFPPAPSADDPWRDVPKNLPFAAVQKVYVTGTLAPDGTLHAKVKYTMRGDNELVLRVAFHQTPRAKWDDVAQLLAISDGFRGNIVSASASDPYATKQPFTVEYEISQPKFLDWAKTPIRIPALLPVLSLPDPPPAGGASSSPIDLGTPLDVEAHVSLHLPPGVTVQVPFASSVKRDYATFTSRYSTQANVATATRHITFVLRQIPAARAADYNAFLRAVQNDQNQLFTLDRSATPGSPQAQESAPPRPQP